MDDYVIDPTKLYSDGDYGRRYFTQSLFWEYRNTPSAKGLHQFTLAEYDRDGCYSLYKLYMDYADEYNAAIAILGSWEHWNRLKQQEWFTKYLDKWNEEIEIRDRSQAKATILTEATGGNVQAAKALNDLHKRKAGRPTKEERVKYQAQDKKVNEKVVSLMDHANKIK